MEPATKDYFNLKVIRTMPLLACFSFAYGVILGGTYSLLIFLLGLLLQTVVMFLITRRFEVWTNLVGWAYYFLGWIVGRLIFQPHGNVLFHYPTCLWRYSDYYYDYMTSKHSCRK